MSVVVLKVGGASTGGVAEAVAELRAAGSQVCVVHGAGPQISEEMERRGLELQFVGGRRVTTPEVLEVVRESFAAVNAAVCAAIGAGAVGSSATRSASRAEQVPELGLVGRAVPSAPRTVLAALAAGRVPVVSPLAPGPLNVNADEAAAALAVGIGADADPLPHRRPRRLPRRRARRSRSARRAPRRSSTGLVRRRHRPEAAGRGPRGAQRARRRDRRHGGDAA